MDDVNRIHFHLQPLTKKGRRSILDLEPLVQTECQMNEMKKKIKDLTEELIDVRGHKVEVDKVCHLLKIDFLVSFRLTAIASNFVRYF